MKINNLRFAKVCALAWAADVLVLGTTFQKTARLWKTEKFHVFYHHVYSQAVRLLECMKKAARWAAWSTRIVLAREFRSGVRIAAEESSLPDWGA
ncbi:MAG: hypothetical protein ACN6OS_02280 [Comamonas testosteroni]|uniref:hypothetical protein n=1 Tax=Comamonas testosteroni TaxID=285 RepID=UPI003D0CE749